MSSLSQLYGGGGGGTPINGVAKFNRTDTTFTDDQNQVWLKSGNLITSGFATYPDAQVRNGFLSLANYTNNEFYLGNLTGSPVSVTFDPTGLLMNICEISSALIIQYDLTSPYDITSANYTGGRYLNTTGITSQPHRMQYNSDGTRVAVVGADNSAVYQYTLSTPYILQHTVSGAFETFYSSFVNQTDFSWNNDGTLIAIYAFGEKRLFLCPVKEPFNISTIGAAVQQVDMDVLNTFLNNAFQFQYNSDGTKMYWLDIVNNAARGVYEFALKTPYHIEDMSWTGAYYNLSDIAATPRGIFITPDDSKMFIVCIGNDDIYEIDLGQAIGQLRTESQYDYIRIK